MLQIHFATGHRDKGVAVDFNGRIVAVEKGVVDVYGVLAYSGVRLHGRVEPGEHVVSGGIFRTFATLRDGLARPAVGFKGEACVLGIDGMAAECQRVVGHVVEGTPFELHPSHLPQRDVVKEGGVVLREQVAVVHAERASVEVALVVNDTAAGVVVGVGQERHGLAVVDEERAVGLDDASGGVPVVIPKPRAYAAARILNDRPVLQLHGSLVLCNLPFGAVANHLDALPHHIIAGRGQCAAIDDELAAGTDDEAGAGRHFNRTCDRKCHS